MLGYLILLFTVMPVVELVLLIHVGTYIGAWNTVAIVIITGVAGAFMAREQGFSTLRKIQDNVNSGVMPADEIINGILILCGGIMFLAPGFITDLLGFIMLIPPARNFIKKIIEKKIQKMIREDRIITIGR